MVGGGIGGSAGGPQSGMGLGAGMQPGGGAGGSGMLGDRDRAERDRGETKDEKGAREAGVSVADDGTSFLVPCRQLCSSIPL
jgi:hypothetical protein